MRREVTDPSLFIIVGVDIMKAFNYMSRGPQDPTRVDWVKQLHGDLSARHRLHINTHHWLVYNKNTHTEVQNIPLRFDCQYCPADGINFILSVMKRLPGGTWHTERHPGSGLQLFGQAGYHIRISEETLHIQGDTKHSHMIELIEILNQNRQPVNVVFHELEKQHIFSRVQLHYNLRVAWWVLPVQTSHCCKGKMSGQSCRTEQRASPAWTWNQHRY